MKISKEKLINLVKECMLEANLYDEFGYHNEEPDIDDIQQLQYILVAVKNLHLIDSDVYAQELSDKIYEELRQDKIPVELLTKFNNRISM